MKRNCSLDEISDGKLYSVNDLVEVSCNGCKGLASCCHGMGNSIILDPFDIYQLSVKLGMSFEQLLAGNIELNIVDGIILPNLKMTGASESCAFLSDSGKCTIHSYRPGICRIFPLGRYYENHDFKYFLQTNECNNNTKTMVKVSKWIDTPDLKNYQQFLINWHYFLNDVEDIAKSVQDSNLLKNINMFLLNNFYVKNYDSSVDFYIQFNERLNAALSIINLAGWDTSDDL